VVAVGIIPIGRTVYLCGTDWVLAYLTIIAIFSAGGFPIAIIIVAITLANIVPRLRSPWLWFGSSVVFAAMAASSVALAARHSGPAAPGLCSL
jgi:hypothetical protein